MTTRFKPLLRSDEKRAGWLLASMSSMMLIPLVSGAIYNPRFWSERFGINETALQIPLAWVLAGVVALGYILYTTLVVPTVRQHIGTWSWLKVVGIFAALVSGAFEEIMFRALLMDWLQAGGAALVWQVAASAIAFGIVHGLWGLFSRNRRGLIPMMLSTAVLGAALAIVYIVAERNILPCIVAHVVINMLIEPWLILSAVRGDS